MIDRRFTLVGLLIIFFVVIVLVCCPQVYAWDTAFSWDANPVEENVTHYNLYWTITPGSDYTQSNSAPILSTQYQDTGTRETLPFVWYVITAVNVDESGLNRESSFSNEVMATRPDLLVPPPTAPTGLQIIGVTR